MSLEKPQSEAKIEREKQPSFFERIGRPELKEKLTPKTPWAYFTMELYGSGIRGGGGLGILAADTLEIKKKEGIPSVFITPFYTRERSQRFKGFEQQIKLTKVKPKKRGFKPRYVLGDCWYGSVENMKFIEKQEWKFIFGVKENRHVSITKNM